MNKLSKYIIIVAILVIICTLLWFFSEIVWYVIIAAIISLIGKPLVTLITSFSFKNIRVPNWLASLVTLVIIIAVIGSILLFIAPIIGTIVNEVASIDFEGLSQNISQPLHNLNKAIIKSFPTVGHDFKIEAIAINQLKEFVTISSFSRAFSSIADFFINFAIGLFSVIFISFFFLQEGNLLENIMKAIVPDKYEDNMKRAFSSIENLLSRYFIGIIIESCLITILNTIGLYFIAGFTFKLAVIIAFTSGVLNIIPYVGPLAGEILGVLMGVLKHYSTPDAGPILPLLVAILAVMVVTQLIDNYLFQPYIYSSSVKAHPLEIFIVILIAGYVGGVIGMLVAIPAYTVFRVFAGEFLSKFKIVQKLTKSIKGEIK